MVQLWIPGPTEVRPEILAACAHPMIGHRSATMTETIERMDPHLRLAFGAAEDGGASVAVHSASASAMNPSDLNSMASALWARGLFGRSSTVACQIDLLLRKSL